METIDFYTSRINYKKQTWCHGENDKKIEINTLNQAQKQQAIEYLKSRLLEIKDKLLFGEDLEEWTLLKKTIITFLVQLGVSNTEEI